MARVAVTVEDVQVGGVPGVSVECSECEHVVTCRGVSQRSVRRALAQLRETCPEGAENFYVDPDVESRDP